jgi:hypothetical protein
MWAMGSQIGVAGINVGISSAGSLGCTTEVNVGGGGAERPEALRMRRRCLSDVVCGMAGSGGGIDVGGTGGGGSGPVGGGVGGTSNAGGMPCPWDKLEHGALSTLVLRLCERDVGAGEGMWAAAVERRP